MCAKVGIERETNHSIRATEQHACLLLAFLKTQSRPALATRVWKAYELMNAFLVRPGRYH